MFNFLSSLFLLLFLRSSFFILFKFSLLIKVFFFLSLFSRITIIYGVMLLYPLLNLLFAFKITIFLGAIRRYLTLMMISLSPLFFASLSCTVDAFTNTTLLFLCFPFYFIIFSLKSTIFHMNFFFLPSLSTLQHRNV